MNIISENNKEMSKDEATVRSMLINEKSFESNTRIEGFSLLKNLEETTTSTGSPMVRFFFQGTGGGTFQANIILTERLTTTDELYTAIGKLVHISGVVTQFNSMFLLNLDKIPVVLRNTEIKLADFFLETEDLSKYVNYLTNKLEEISLIDEQFKTYVTRLQNLNIIKLLSTSVLDLPTTYKGDSIKLVAKIVQDLDNIKLEKNNDKIYIILIAILYLSLEQWNFNNTVKSKQILKFDSLDKMQKIFQIVNDCGLLENFLNYNTTDEFKHLYSVFNFNEEPLTLTANLIKLLYDKNLEIIKIENIFNGLKEGTIKNIDNKQYIRLRRGNK